MYKMKIHVVCLEHTLGYPVPRISHGTMLASVHKFTHKLRVYHGATILLFFYLTQCNPIEIGYDVRFTVISPGPNFIELLKYNKLLSTTAFCLLEYGC